MSLYTFEDFREHVTLEHNYEDRCVWVTIADDTRKCVTPEKARDLANGLEHINNIGAASEHLTQDEETAALIDRLREMADDVKAGGEDR